MTYFRGEYGVHTITREEPLYTAVTSDFGAPGPIIDFQAPLTHTLIAANSRKKGKFEKTLSRGPTADQHRGHHQRRRPGWDADYVQRRARRSAVQFLRSVAGPVPDAGVLVPQSVSAVPVRAPSVLAGAIPLRRVAVGSEPGLPESRRCARRSNGPWWKPLWHLPVQSLPTTRSSQPARSITTNGLPTQA